MREQTWPKALLAMTNHRSKRVKLVSGESDRNRNLNTLHDGDINRGRSTRRKKRIEKEAAQAKAFMEKEDMYRYVFREV